MPEWEQFSEGDQRKRKKHVVLTQEFPWKSCFTTYIVLPTYQGTLCQDPKSFPKNFSTKMKPTKCPAKEKNEARKAKEEGIKEFAG